MGTGGCISTQQTKKKVKKWLLDGWSGHNYEWTCGGVGVGTGKLHGFKDDTITT